jgi:hypothetical protein
MFLSCEYLHANTYKFYNEHKYSFNLMWLLSSKVPMRAWWYNLFFYRLLQRQLCIFFKRQVIRVNHAHSEGIYKSMLPSLFHELLWTFSILINQILFILCSSISFAHESQVFSHLFFLFTWFLNQDKIRV